MAHTEAEHYTRMTEAPVAPLIARLAVPTTISLLVTSIYNLVDTAFVGTLGTSASGAVGIVFGFMSIIQAFGFMYGMGSGSIIARLLGQKNVDEASVVASTGVTLSFLTGLAIALVSAVFLTPIVFLMGSTETIAPYAEEYVRFMLISAPFMTASFTMNQILRLEGKAALGMVGMTAGCFLNIAGDAVFMFGFGMGITGAGLSTALSQVVSFGILLSMFLRGKSTSKLSSRLISPTPERVADIVATGLPSLIRQGLNSITTMLLNAQAALFGDAAVAAMSIVARIVFFAFSLTLGVGQGFQPVAGFNYGAGRYGRVRDAHRVTIFMGEALVAAILIVMMLSPAELLRIFRDDPAVVEIGIRALRLQGISLLFLPLIVATEMLYQSTGHKLGASIMSLLRGGLVFIPLILILPRFRGIAGVQEAQALANALMFLPAIGFAAHFFRELPEEAA